MPGATGAFQHLRGRKRAASDRFVLRGAQHSIHSTARSFIQVGPDPVNGGAIVTNRGRQGATRTGLPLILDGVQVTGVGSLGENSSRAAFIYGSSFLRPRSSISRTLSQGNNYTRDTQRSCLNITQNVQWRELNKFWCIYPADYTVLMIQTYKQVK